MAFLKKIEAYGFKSFADPLKIEFDNAIVGIVGPNGSGKSNINDAIRWVLGEQSVKSLRGEKTQDIIFSGAAGKSPLNVAQVTLFFDNSKKIFKCEHQEVQITRKIHRHTSENEYYINNTRVRLKDVQQLVLDTGLSKGSLAIISQGNVANFADAKAEERRYLFEEAAGIAKYKKRKEETLRTLAKTNENLNRVHDIINEISRKLGPLAKQAAAAKMYLEIRNELKKYEVRLLINDGTEYLRQLQLLNTKILSGENAKDKINLQLRNADEQLKIFKNKMYEIEQAINNAESDLNKFNNLLYTLEQQKLVLEQQKKDWESKHQDDSVKINLKNDINQKLWWKKQKLTLKNESKSKLLAINEKLKQLSINYQNFVNQRNGLYQILGQIKADLNYNQQHQKQQANFGVTTILNNRTSLYGIVDKVANLITVPKKYETALSIILGKNANSIVVDTDKNAIKAVNFLKNNQAGVVTFLPLDTLQVKPISQQDEIIAKSQPGYLGIASEIVTIKDPVSKKAIVFLLGRNIICQDLTSATNISQLLSARYQCVSVDGQIIRTGGAIVGGYHKNKTVWFQNDEQIEQLKLKINQLEQELNSINLQINQYQHEINTFQQEKIKTELVITRFAAEITEIEHEINLKTTEYQSITGEKLVFATNEKLHDIFANYETNKYKKNQVMQDLKTLRDDKRQLLEMLQTVEIKIQQQQNDYQKIIEKLNHDKLLNVKLEAKMEQITRCLAESYELTFEHAQATYHQKLDDEKKARLLVQDLRAKLAKLGYVNINAIAEYETENKRYLELKTKYDQLKTALSTLLKVIDEMDKSMINKFKALINQINAVLPETFETLFGGGTCVLRYSNPEDLLTTGIDVLANPPGKKIRNLNLLSGGEKSLVTLAVLFAILKVKPLPLIILDEVEAPLDPANLERFARYIRNFSQYTQFIIVTHRPATMENCDVLYGTTMENQGITKVVNIKLSDAKKIIATQNQEPNLPLNLN